VVADGGAEPGELEPAIDALYAADPDEFIAARDRLAAELRRAGRRDEARNVARLRRPTLAAWAVDHLALRAPHRIEGLVAAGERLRRAHDEVLSGGDPRLLSRAAEERRALIAALTDEALDLLRSRGGGDPDSRREEIEATLEATSSDAGVATLVRRGRLITAAPRPAGFAGLLDLPVDVAPAGEGGVPVPAGDGEGEGRDEQELERAREEASRLEQLAAEAAADADRAQSTLDRAVAEVERLEAELAGARARAAAAKEEAKQARTRREAARRAATATARQLRPGVGT
jgi:hypothetical protein